MRSANSTNKGMLYLSKQQNSEKYVLINLLRSDLLERIQWNRSSPTMVDGGRFRLGFFTYAHANDRIEKRTTHGSRMYRFTPDDRTHQHSHFQAASPNLPEFFSKEWSFN